MRETSKQITANSLRGKWDIDLEGDRDLPLCPGLLPKKRESKYSFPTALVLGLLFCLRVSAAQQQGSHTHSATIPISKLEQSDWAARHNAILKQVKDSPDAILLLIGDSITQNYEKADPPDENFLPIWNRFYAPRHALNLGFSGDTTGNVLWRLDHGEVDGLHPKAAVVLIGTNNTSLESAGETELGIDAVIAKLEQKLPTTKILLLGILPRREHTAAIQEIDHYLDDRYASNETVTYLDISNIFYKEGKLNEDLFYDPREYHSSALHPDTVGQRMMAEAIEPILTQLLGDGSRQYLATLNDVNTAIIPVPRLEIDSYDWYERHRNLLRLESASNPQIVLIGDSITHFWGGLPSDHAANGQKAWDHAFKGLKVLNLGFGWDRTQNVLWRLEHGEFDGLHPKTVVVNIGTNNLVATENARSNTPEEIVQGILTIRDKIHSKSPPSRIIIMGVFPRSGSTSPFRQSIRTINQLLSEALDRSPDTTFLDIGSQFLKPNGELLPDVMSDALHPSEMGYEIWAKALLGAGIRN